MRKALKRGLVVLTLLGAVFFTVSIVHADTIIHNQVIVKSDDISVSHDLDEVKMEVENGKTKVCICRCLCFRALQLLAEQFPGGVIPRDDIKIVTGFTTDGPEELFVEVMGWPHADLTFTANATAPALLTVQDAFFFFIQKSTGRAWKVSASDDLYPATFFDYRTLVKTKTATEEQITFFKTALRPQAVANMGALPLIDKFNVQAIPFFADDEVLRLPAVFVSGGVEYSVELEHKGNNLFELIKVVSSN